MGIPGRATSLAPRPGAGPRSTTRSGYALPLVLVLALVIAGLIHAVHTVVSGYRDHTSLFRDGEIAFHAASGGLALVERGLEALFSGPPPLDDAERELFEFVTRSLPSDLDRHEEVLRPALLADLVPRDTDGTVGAKLRFLEVRPLEIPIPAGFRADPYDKTGILEIEVEARVGAAIRRLSVRRPFRSFYRLPPVAGRFSLLLGELVGDSEAANVLAYAPRFGMFHRAGTRDLAWPLTVYPMAAPAEPRTPRSRFGDDPALPVAQGGWIGLLGPTPWVLALAFGPGLASPMEEGFLVRNFEATYPSKVLPGTWEKGARHGYARDVLDLPVFTGLGGAEIPEASSILHLAGDSRHRVPPVVLGRAYRRFLAWSKLGRSPDGPFTSLAAVPDEAGFAEVADVFALAGGSGGFARYQELMARSVLEPANRSYDFAVSDDETVGETGRIEAGETPFTPKRHLTADALRPYLAPAAGGSPGFMYPALDAPAAPAVRIGTEDEATLFEGPPDLLSEGLATLVEARAVWKVVATPEATAEEHFRRRFLADGRTLRIGTTVHVATERLVLGELEIERGGTLSVDGELVIGGPVIARPGEALALVSLRGNVTVAGPHPIQAALVACAGEVVPSPAGLDLRGALVSRRFDPARWLSPRAPSRVVWDEALNPARVEFRAHQFRVHLGSDREVLVERR